MSDLNSVTQAQQRGSQADFDLSDGSEDEPYPPPARAGARPDPPTADATAAGGGDVDGNAPGRLFCTPVLRATTK